MKKGFLVIIFSFLIYGVKAQDKFIPTLQIGVHGGVNYGNVRFEPSIRSTPVEMNNYGFILNYVSEPHLGIQLEANISQRGWQSNDTSFHHIRKMSYLEFPLLTYLTFGKKFFHFNINGGPYVAFYRDSFEGFNISNPVADSVKSIVFKSYEYHQQYGNRPKNNLDYGYVLGAGFGFRTVVGEITFRFRYTQGLTNLFNQYPDGEFRFSQMKTYYAGIGYLYTFKLKSLAK
jgi:hypothetical protein